MLYRASLLVLFTLPISAMPSVVIGFLGGFDNADDPNRSVRKVILDLQLADEPGLHAESFSNHNVDGALDYLRRHLARGPARVILFGQSWGGDAALRLARTLKESGTTVALTVQVDSVGFEDRVIPSNVRKAANFYQHEAFTIRGRERIVAEYGAATQILGNVRCHYPLLLPYPQPESWARKWFGGAHAKMEADPLLWLRVRALILAAVHGTAIQPL